MKLVSFRVQNFKKIRDTTEIPVTELTAFVGKNEAGKSTIFQGLAKLNPSNPQDKLDGLREFPRRRFSDEFTKKDWPVATGRFLLDDAERSALGACCADLAGTTHVVVTRHYQSLDIQFVPAALPALVRGSELLADAQALSAAAEDLLRPADVSAEQFQQFKPALQKHAKRYMDFARAKSAEAVSRGELEQHLTSITGTVSEAWQRDVTKPHTEALRQHVNRATQAESADAAKKWVEKNMPKFVYFDRYDVLDSAVFLPQFQGALGQPNQPKARITHCVFRHVGLDVQKMTTLGRHQPGQPAESASTRRDIDERAIRFSSASNAMTEKFASWWEQRRHRFRYQVDGDYFRVWVSDDLDPSEIELEQRSAGLQYFFSFYVVFLVELEDAHKNAVLLLDEPGLHMHGTAQAKIVHFMERLAKDNQVMYSTHSPFMIDATRLDRVRAVYEAEDGSTKVSSDVWPRDKDCLFPLQAALGYQLAQSLFLGPKQVIVEGITDHWIFTALSIALEKAGKKGLAPGITVVPCAGLSKLVPLTCLLIGHQIQVAALLDGDARQSPEFKRLQREKLLQPTSCFLLDDFIRSVPGATVEDLFPEAEFVKVASAALGQAITLTPAEQALVGNVKKAEAAVGRAGGKFEKWRVGEALRDKILADPAWVPQSTLAAAEAIFAAVTKALA